MKKGGLNTRLSLYRFLFRLSKRHPRGRVFIVPMKASAWTIFGIALICLV